MGQVVDNDIGVDAVAFDEPFAVVAVDADLGCAGQAVVGLGVAAG